MIRTRKPLVLLFVAILALLMLVPLYLHISVTSLLKDTATELRQDVHWPTMLPFQSIAPSRDLFAAARKPPSLHADPARTTRCSSAPPVYDIHGQPRPLVQYAIMMDAGSTGSRIHVYKFNYCSSSPELEFEHFDHIEPGLSAYGADATRAAASLKPLLDKAMSIVPTSLQSCTPISLKATAGLRLLGAEQSAAIIQAVRQLLTTAYPFPIADGPPVDGTPSTRGVEIMDGREEGVFAWITVNYLLNLIGSPSGARTAAVLDLGGGSTQIVFEPHLAGQAPMHPGDHVYELRDFENSTFTLYQNSYLGYGLKQARQATNSLSALLHWMSHPGERPADWATVAPENASVPSPCYAAGSKKAAKVAPGVSEAREVTMTGTHGGFRACQRFVEVMMDKDAECHLAPCSFAGVYQPKMSESFKDAEIIALSYFYDRITPLGLGPRFTIKELGQLAERVCAPPSAWRSLVPKFSASALAELEQRADICLDLTYMHALLRLGYELDESRTITLAKQISDFELGWALGAQLAVLQQGVLCK